MKRDHVLISYRRSDAAGSTTAIRKTLLDRFGEQPVFRDVEGIDPGADFPKTLRDELKLASVVLAVIGKGWLLAANEFGQRRIDFEDDWIRTELSLALNDPVDVHRPPHSCLDSGSVFTGQLLWRSVAGHGR